MVLSEKETAAIKDLQTQEKTCVGYISTEFLSSVMGWK